MTSGICAACGLGWSSKCHKCRSVFMNMPKTIAQCDCEHENLVVKNQPDECPYSGHKYPPIVSETIAK